MRVLLDATAIPANRGGVGRYVDAVVRELARQAALSDSAFQLVVACQARDLDTFHSAAPGATLVGLPLSSISKRLLWEQSRLPRLAARVGADIVYSPHYTFPLLLPLLSRARHVVTVWDLTFFSHPVLHSPLKARFFRAWIRLGQLLKVTVTTASQASATELERYAGTPFSRIHVTPLAVDTDVFSPPTDDDIDAFRTSLTPPVSKWIAFLGTLEPRKNVPSLIEAYRTVTAELSNPPTLLLAGAQGWDEQVSPALERARADGFDVRSLGYLPLTQLRALLGGAELVVYPSLGEGFGLPVLEAMASGAAVLTTKRLSLPEVGGEAVAYSEPDAAHLTQAMNELMRDPERRQHLREAATARAASFSWERTVEDLLAAFRAALPHSARPHRPLRHQIPRNPNRQAQNQHPETLRSPQPRSANTPSSHQHLQNQRTQNQHLQNQRTENPTSQTPHETELP